MKDLKYFKEIPSTDLPLGALISIIHRVQNININQGIKKLGINASQAGYLLKLLHSTNMTQDELSTQYHIDKGAVARGLCRLEEDEFIIRKRNQTNKRCYQISLTPKGEEVAKEIEKLNNIWEEHICKDLTQEKKEELQENLKMIVLKTIELNEK
ncbi:MAG: MarR family transcriptional regulator [Methanobacteriaceae archaeon]|nr:MarR family transcriptional regulator [Methanobacteriaceae archaeon]